MELFDTRFVQFVQVLAVSGMTTIHNHTRLFTEHSLQKENISL